MSYTDVFGGNLIFPSRVSYNKIITAVDVQLQWPTEQQIEGVNVVADVIDVETTATGLNIDMPDARNTSTGNKATFNNVGGDDFTVRDATGGTIQSVNPGEQWVLVLTDNSTEAGSWSTFQLGGNAATQASASALAGDGLRPDGNQLDQIIDSDVESVTPFNVVAGDRAKCLIYIGGAGTCNLPNPGDADIGNAYFFMLRNSGSGTLNIVPASGDIDGSANLNLDPNGSTFIFTDGTDYYTIGLTVASTIAFDFVSIAVPGSGDFVLSGANLDRISYRFTGALTGNRRIVVPDTTQQYWVDNQTTGAFTLEVSTNLGSGQTVSQNNSAILYCDATDVINAVSSTSVTFPITIGQGGTSATTASGARTNLNAAFDGIEIQTNADSGLSGGGDLTANRALVLDINNLDDTPTIASTDSIAFEDSDDNLTYKATLSDLSAALEPQTLFNSGAEVLDAVATNAVNLKSSGNTDTEPRELRFTHQDGTVRGFIGYDSFSEEFDIENRINAADAQIRISTSNANAEVLLQGRVQISNIATNLGTAFRGTANNNATIRFTDTGFLTRGEIGYRSSNELEIVNGVDSGRVVISARDSLSVERLLIDANPNDDVALYHNPGGGAIEVARTLDDGAGGFEVNNQLTGGGFERVLTTGDNAASSFTGTLTGTTGSPSGTIQALRMTASDGNDMVHLSCNVDIVGTSNSTQMTLTGIPVALRPTTSRRCVCWVRNESKLTVAAAEVDSSGVITFYAPDNTSNTTNPFWSFTTFGSTGSKGLENGWQLSYRLD